MSFLQQVGIVAAVIHQIHVMAGYDDVCPSCGRHEADGPSFERLRRITGYLVGSLDRWNDAKQAEEKARVKHGVTVNKNGVYTTEQKAERELQKANQAKMMAKV